MGTGRQNIQKIMDTSGHKTSNKDQILQIVADFHAELYKTKIIILQMNKNQYQKLQT